MPLRSPLALALAAFSTATPAVAVTDHIRIATFNASLNRSADGALAEDLASGNDPQLQSVAEIIQRVNPDILLINEFDYQPGNTQAFIDGYLSVPQSPSDEPAAPAVTYDHIFEAPSNTGVPSGVDLDNDGTTDGPNDAFGFGFFPGQFAMTVVSKYDIVEEDARTFQTFRWADMPGARLPENADGTSFYSDAALEVFRLSSKSHWDLPIDVDGDIVHILASHPTPPVFDGPEDRNGRRNADEIRFWADYVDGADYIYDDSGETGGLAPNARFVIMGDQNADPFDGDSVPGTAQQIVEHPKVNGSVDDAAITPASAGGTEQALAQGGVNADHQSNPAFDTADFGLAGPGNPDIAPGNLRVDYVLPSLSGLILEGSGVFWPASTSPFFDLAGFETSDHRLVYIDVAITAPIPVPAPALLLTAALGGLGLVGRRRRLPIGTSGNA